MMMATIFGIDIGIKVYPIDWWGSGDNRTKQADYMKTPEYKTKEKEEESMVVANEVMQEFEKKYIDLRTLWNENKKGYEFFMTSLKPPGVVTETLILIFLTCMECF